MKEGETLYRGTRKQQYRKLGERGMDHWMELQDWGWNWKQPCPVCGTKLWKERWNEEYRGVVETIEKCRRCNYQRHWSYGRSHDSVGEMELHYHPHLLTEKQQLQIERAFQNAVKREREKYRKWRKKMYKKQ